MIQADTSRGAVKKTESAAEVPINCTYFKHDNTIRIKLKEFIDKTSGTGIEYKKLKLKIE